MRTVATITTATLALAALALPATAAASPATKVTICHATASTTNPYVKQSIAPAALAAHGAKGINANDIIPPTKTYPGKNWDTLRASIHANGCVQPPKPTQTPPPPPTDPVPPTTPSCAPWTLRWVPQSAGFDLTCKTAGWLSIVGDPFIYSTISGVTRDYTIGYGYHELTAPSGARLAWNTDSLHRVNMLAATTGTSTIRATTATKTTLKTALTTADIVAFEALLYKCVGPVNTPISCTT